MRHARADQVARHDGAAPENAHEAEHLAHVPRSFRVTDRRASGSTGFCRVMSGGTRIAPDEYLKLPLEVHRILHDVPLKDVSAVDLPGGGPGRTIRDVRGLGSVENRRRATLPVRALVALRGALGRWLGWDAPSHSIASHSADSYASRVTPELLRQSADFAGKSEGLGRFLYATDREAVREVRNATVHAFL